MSRQRGVVSDSKANWSVPVRCLGPLEIALRQGTSDASVLLETLVGEFHLPPKGLQPAVIWDLGANIGLTAAHYAVLFPDAKITAVEANQELVGIARINTFQWKHRVDIVEAAVWAIDEELLFSFRFGDEYGGVAHKSGHGVRVQGRSLNSLLAETEFIDFLKMDIEGAEKRVLKDHTEWASKVRCIKVECHDDYSREDCIFDLQALGFTAVIDAAHWNCVVGQRIL